MSTWKVLFDRAETHDVSQSAICEALERRRSADDADAGRGTDGDERGVDDEARGDVDDA
ncbi:hypothetical protein [Natronobeatus ordinarius]|uniref:hypothetical protein n=1 Tax=Natronobeatus ordinarius TaxID=2963433 RepID=UPI0020CD5411|nr:hypothetical protein [Natronobeatus ordinarius]